MVPVTDVLCGILESLKLEPYTHDPMFMLVAAKEKLQNSEINLSSWAEGKLYGNPNAPQQIEVLKIQITDTINQYHAAYHAHSKATEEDREILFKTLYSLIQEYHVRDAEMSLVFVRFVSYLEQDVIPNFLATTDVTKFKKQHIASLLGYLKCISPMAWVRITDSIEKGGIDTLILRKLGQATAKKILKQVFLQREAVTRISFKKNAHMEFFESIAKHLKINQGKNMLCGQNVMNKELVIIDYDKELDDCGKNKKDYTNFSCVHVANNGKLFPFNREESRTIVAEIVKTMSELHKAQKTVEDPTISAVTDVPQSTIGIATTATIATVPTAAPQKKQRIAKTVTFSNQVTKYEYEKTGGGQCIEIIETLSEKSNSRKYTLRPSDVVTPATSSN